MFVGHMSDTRDTPNPRGVYALKVSVSVLDRKNVKKAKSNRIS